MAVLQMVVLTAAGLQVAVPKAIAPQMADLPVAA